MPRVNNNPEGVNGHKNCPPKDDARVEQLLIEYHNKGITDRKLLSKLFRAEHSIQISEATIARRRAGLGLMGSGKTTKTLPEATKRQLVLDAMGQDPAQRKGPHAIKEVIVTQSSVHLTRDYIASEMQKHAPEGFASRAPTAAKHNRTQLVSLGPHHEWSGNGHDKLVKIGFPIWGVRDKWSGKWLGLWVLPNNRLKAAVAYLYLQLVEEQKGELFLYFLSRTTTCRSDPNAATIFPYQGFPIQMTTDCGSENTTLYKISNVLREIFASHLPLDELAAHRFMQSINNITIERGWLSFRLQWGDNVHLFWEAGAALYNPTDPKQKYLVDWLWPTLIQQELDELRERLNNHVVRYNKDKKLPSGSSPNVNMALFGEKGGEWCLQSISDSDMGIIQHLKDTAGGEELLWFVTPEYSARAQSIFDTLPYSKLSFQNVWHVFSDMLPLV
ncbi:hypothetical protein CVT24_002686 [Panaeolus cyanescens]|uniref:Integrase catalytic domain-containing protein n=1 Tax=Panaeolus cyanescens TaxID=181874 RepID=A0A409YY85_9AGAR|nr:hypothetical protein CVT24_002686 [Panaeolus cyanescens]